MKIALLVPSYKRFEDLINTLKRTTICSDDKFIVLANNSDSELSYIKDNFSNAIVIDEKNYGKLGVVKAYNLAFEVAKKEGFDYSILFADDVIPFKDNWLKELKRTIKKNNIKFGVFGTDECHHGYFGWNFLGDMPIAHFFVIENSVLEILFLEKYEQYVVDLEISFRIRNKKTPIHLIGIKLNHLRSGLHRDSMASNYERDSLVFKDDYPDYAHLMDEVEKLTFLPFRKKTLTIESVDSRKIKTWPGYKTIKPNTSFLKKVTKKISKAKKLLFS